MQLLGLSFTKIQAERFSEIKGASGIKINSHIDFPSMEKDKVLGMKEDVLKIEFALDFVYDPKIANISFKGVMLFKATEEEMKPYLNAKKKAIDPETHKRLMNTVLRKCTVRALQLEDELGVPYHIKLPRLE